MTYLNLIIIFLVAAVIVVPLFHKLNLGPTLGYLIAGILLGPSVTGLVWDSESILHIAELGVVLLMFIIGLELQPSRLWVLRKSVFGVGSLQVALTGLVLGSGLMLLDLSWPVALTLGFGFSLSSTAIVLQSLAERSQLVSAHGRDSFGVLLFQDLAVIPLIAVLPLLSSQNSEATTNYWKTLFPILVLIAVVVVGRFGLRAVFKYVASTKNKDLFTAATLLLVFGMSSLMYSLGISMALGAFLAGVLLADSEYRHELEADIEPFKGLLLGLFFISIGMSAQFSAFSSHWALVITLTAGLMILKAGVLFGILKALGKESASSFRSALFLSQGGEFAFVLFSQAKQMKILTPEMSEILILVVTLSMLITPFLFFLDDKVLSQVFKKVENRDYDKIEEGHPVIIAGFGRFGQIIARILTLRKIKFTALEKNPTQVDFVRKFGNKIHFGDASRRDLLESAKIDEAKAFVLAIDDIDDSLKTAEAVRKHWPHVPIYARARNRFHAYKLLDLNVRVMERETLHSSIVVAGKLLTDLGLSEQDSKVTTQRFLEHDLAFLAKQHAVYQDEAQLIQTAKQAMSDLETLFESDSAEIKS